MDVTVGRAPGRRAGFRFLAFVLSGLFWCAASAQAGPIDEARSFLLSQQRADGAIAGPADIATAEQATAEALVALASPGAVHDAGVAFLGQAPFVEQPTRYLARFIVASPGNAAALAELLSRQNADGSFGVAPASPGSVLDTAFALE